MSVTLHKPPPPTVPITLSIVRPIHWNSWVAGVVCLVVGVLVPVLNVATSEKSALHASDFLVTLVGKLTCYAIVAVAMDLVWGYAGVLSLCHAMFFALGGYAMGMYLMRAIGTEGMYRSNLPDFMVFLDWKELPWYWQGFNRFGFALTMALLLPGIVAFVFGFFAFRSRIGGVYFSIVTQAMTYADASPRPVMAHSAARVEGSRSGYPRIRLKSVRPLLPPKPVALRKKRSIAA